MSDTEDYRLDGKQLAAMQDASALYDKVFGSGAGKELLRLWRIDFDTDVRGTDIYDTHVKIGRRDVVKMIEYHLSVAEAIRSDEGWMEVARGLDK